MLKTDDHLLWALTPHLLPLGKEHQAWFARRSRHRMFFLGLWKQEVGITMPVLAAVLGMVFDKHITVAASKLRREKLARYSHVRGYAVQSHGLCKDATKAGVQVILQGARPGARSVCRCGGSGQTGCGVKQDEHQS